MKKRIVILVLAGCLLGGCGSNGRNPDHTASITVSDDVTMISVSHIVGGQMTEWAVSGEDTGTFRAWVEGLKYRHEQFEDGNSPGDTDGGEVYSFVFAGGTDSEISYVINGPYECYLLMEGEWYRVENPSDPPVGMEENAGDFGSNENAAHPESGNQAGEEQGVNTERDEEAGNGGQEGGEQGADMEGAEEPEDGGQEGGEQGADMEGAEESEDGGQEDTEQGDEWGLTLRAESVSAEGCTIVFVKQGGAPTGELSSGSWYRLEKKEGDEWTEVPYAQGIDDELAWTMEAWIIPEEGRMEFEVNWSYLYGELPSGTYRIVKEILNSSGAGDSDRKWYDAEFSL